MTEAQIIEKFDGDSQIVEIWKLFLVHNGWMNHPDGKWEVTPKGRDWIQKKAREK